MNNEKYLYNIFQETIKYGELNFSKFATLSSQAIRKKPEHKKRYRSPFAVDKDRILYSGAYRRYQGKTQVVYFSNLFDEEMSNRSLHTTYVSQVARTIGKVLRLNLDLIEAIALGHDLGHTPFGHDGEEVLSECCVQHGIGKFHHNIQSLQIIDYIANGGTGMNLTFQVRDGIISHDGEVHEEHLKPDTQKTEEDIQNYIRQKKENNSTMVPATLEGCVVRISDTIAYIGQDIEDAIRLGFLERKELPPIAEKLLGSTNNEIVSALVTSVVRNSYGKNYVCFDKETSDALYELKKFNYSRIYNHPVMKREKNTIRRGVRILFDKYMSDLKKKNVDSKFFLHFLNRKSACYKDKFNDAEKVRDFIATMTDRYLNQELEDFILPGRAQ
ncbi:MAG: HD domain-containing protein [Candidatus Cloacimonadota bacterium]|nr:HD domain-containing protein [Candidatus Cloacimonadota bacterium]